MKTFAAPDLLARTSYPGLHSLDHFRIGGCCAREFLQWPCPWLRRPAMLPEGMRPSSIWFIIAAFWLADTVLRIARGHAHQAWLPALIALMFVIVGLLYVRRERKAVLK
jgi:hypothetical protein